MEEKKLTYKLIRAAAAGEPQAQEDILNEHTNSLAAIEEQKDKQKTHYIDEGLKDQSQSSPVDTTRSRGTYDDVETGFI